MEPTEPPPPTVHRTVGDARVEVVRGDLVVQDVDVIVNAANERLLGGSGVDGAIHRAAGPALLAECRTVGGCPTGEARITGGHLLPARHVIHTVGPVYGVRRNPDGTDASPALLAAAHRNSLLLAGEHGLTSIAYPGISIGVYGYPVAEAAPIAVETVVATLPRTPSIELVRFVLFNDEAEAAYAAALQEV